MTAGQLVICMAAYISGSGGLLWTVSDTSSNVATWNQNQVNDTTVSQYLEIAWGFATTTAACTPKVTINSATSNVVELAVASFNVPSPTITQDGALAKGLATVATTSVTLPTGNGGAGNNDLMLNVVGTQANFTTYNSPWTTGANTGNGYGYIINSDGNVANNATTTSGAYVSITVAVQALPPRAFQPNRMPLGV